MPKFRKKPVEVDAWRVRDLTRAASSHWDALPKAIAAAYERGDVLFPVGEDGRAFVRVITLEGIMDGAPTDWIIRGVKGEFYPCKPDIFDATYDAVESTA